MMVEVKNLSLKLGDFELRDISFQVGKGEFYIILGPTGAGKSVIIETLAGILIPDEGQLLLDGIDITLARPEKRNISICYQDYCLFPHLTVEKNIKYGFQYFKEDLEFFHHIVELLKIIPLLNRYPENLSGGEKQRVSLARALMVKPELLLLDEPLSALDSHIKDQLIRDIKKLHQDLGMTTIMVTHSFQEAFFLGQRGSVIHEGKIQQSGSMEEIFMHPNSSYVANFVGLKNVFQTKNFDGMHIDTPYFGIRPENIQLQQEKSPSCLKGTVMEVSDMGSYCELLISSDVGSITAWSFLEGYFKGSLQIGSDVYFRFDPEKIQEIFEFEK